MIYGQNKLSPDLDRPLRLGYFISPPGGAESPRRIQSDELFFELITRGAVYSPDGEILCGPGRVFVHPPGTHTVYQSPLDRHYECLTATFWFATVPEPTGWPRSFQWRDIDEALRFCRELLFAYHHTRVDRSLLGNLFWAQLQFRLDQDRRQKEREQIPPRISAVMARIDKEYMHDLPAAVLAKTVEMSTSHLQARFQQSVGMSPHQYLIQQRIRAARHRLVTTSDPVKQIAAEVGYANTEHFCRAFKKHTGYTAAAFRRRYRVYDA